MAYSAWLTACPSDPAATYPRITTLQPWQVFISSQTHQYSASGPLYMLAALPFIHIASSTSSFSSWPKGNILRQALSVSQTQLINHLFIMPGHESGKGTASFYCLCLKFDWSPMRAGLTSVLFITEAPAPSTESGTEWVLNKHLSNEWMSDGCGFLCTPVPSKLWVH